MKIPSQFTNKNEVQLKRRSDVEGKTKWRRTKKERVLLRLPFNNTNVDLMKI
jgi:hypothetical protein